MFMIVDVDSANDNELIETLVRAYRAGASPRIILDIISEISRNRYFQSISLPHLDLESWEPKYYDEFIASYIQDRTVRDARSLKAFH